MCIGERERERGGERERERGGGREREREMRARKKEIVSYCEPYHELSLLCLSVIMYYDT